MATTDPIPALPQLPASGGLANVAGLRHLWLLEARHCLSLIDPRTLPGNLSGWQLSPTGLQLAEDAPVLHISCPADRAGYAQKSVSSVHGTAYEQTLTLLIPRDHLTTALLVQRMGNRRWVIIYQDANGLRKLVGTPRQPLSLSSELRTAPNGYGLSWVGTTRQPAYGFTDDNLLATLTADAEFSFGFDYDFYS